MSTDSLLRAFNIIEENKYRCDFELEPKPSSFIDKAEEFLELRIPPSYRSFLEKYGCGGPDGLEIYGIINDDFINSGVPDVVWITLKERADWNTPNTLIKIADVGDGFYYYLDASKANREGEYPVVIWGHGMKEGQQEVVYEDFGEFLLEQLKESLDIKI